VTTEAVPAEAPVPAPDTLTLELALPADTLAALLRGPALAALRGGPARGAAFAQTWFDTPDGLLAARGQALEIAPLRRGARPTFRQTLRQVLHSDDPAWLPGAPGAVLAETVLAQPSPPDAAAAGLEAAAPLVALAAAEGHRRTLSLAHDGVTLAVLDGKLRTVAAEQPFARLLLAGPPAAVFAAAQALAAAHPLLPAWPLAETARALALGQAARPLRRGAPALAAAMSVEDGLVHAGLHLAAVLLGLLPALRQPRSVEAVHQARVALRRLRSALAVWRAAIDGDALRGLDAGLRDLARLLGPVRDRDVFAGTLLAEIEAAMAGHEAGQPRALDALRQAVAAQRDAAHAGLVAYLDGAGFRGLVLALLASFATRPWQGTEAAAGPLAPFAASVLARRHRRMVKDTETLAGVPVAVLHALRLKAKRLRYAAEFFAPLFPPKRTRRFLRRLAALQETLGTVNDGAVAGSLVRALPPAGAREAGGREAGGREAAGRAWAEGAIDGFAAARAATARADAERAWARLRASAPFWD
jgi:CHAD domain-containing protein